MRLSVVLRPRGILALITGASQERRLDLGGLDLSVTGTGVLGAVEMLLSRGRAEEEVANPTASSGGTDGHGAPCSYFAKCHELGLLSLTLEKDGNELATFERMRGGAWPPVAMSDPLSPMRVSRFMFVRRDGDKLVAESSLSPVRAVVHDRVVLDLLMQLARPLNVDQLVTECGVLAERGTGALCSLLLGARFIGECDHEGNPREEQDDALAQWEFHDSVFHSRSRLGAHDYPSGGIYPFLGRIEPPPAIPPKEPGERIALHRPELNELAGREGSLSWAIERRRSIREYDGRPLDVHELGEFLYRTARVRDVRLPKAETPARYETSSRPYPSGGAAYDLEVYLVVVECLGLEPGIYHYHPTDHELVEVRPCDDEARRLVLGAKLSAGLSVDPPVVLVLASRFQRLSWKYRGISYATVLKNVGALFQTMYLVATDMGLAPCALGAGDSIDFAKAVGTNHFAQTSVGEFTLGVAPGRSDNGAV